MLSHIVMPLVSFVDSTIHLLVIERFLWRCCHGDGQQYWSDNERTEDPEPRARHSGGVHQVSLEQMCTVHCTVCTVRMYSLR